MSDATQKFFQDLHHREHDRRLRIASGSVRFDIGDGDQQQHWLVRMHDGTVSVAAQATGGDAVVRTDRATFNRIASGEAYFLTAVLRGEATVEGSPRLFALVRRLFPAPPETANAAVPGRGGTAHG
ncbi:MULTISPECIES: SCP2 sterol-binding domain-containing protein [unclassified Micromonospora]|uniref:SCP2 sterol-binding domain-containing protein n=1 Tax=unclassified Micromonospora TaxID=2617518 RepID=UPI00364270FC